MLYKPPTWLSVKGLPKKYHPVAGPLDRRRHCVKDIDHINVKWSLPTMFGIEMYSYTIIDIQDPR